MSFMTNSIGYVVTERGDVTMAVRPSASLRRRAMSHK